MKQGERVGDWILERRLGRGLTASTWLASRSTKDTDAPEAGPARAVLKILDLRDMSDWSVADLFKREADTLGGLSHPGIPKFYGSFEARDGDSLSLVLSMEYIEGESLESIVKSGRRFTDPEVGRILAGLADILAYLAALRPPVVHRDVNPRNILLLPDGSVKLVDFSGARDAVRASLYPGATLVGTAGYTAPEQVAGKATPRSDLYGAATTAVFLLTGSNPAELPSRGMKVDLSGILTPSPELKAVLDSWLEMDQARRSISANDAAAILRGERWLLEEKSGDYADAAATGRSSRQQRTGGGAQDSRDGSGDQDLSLSSLRDRLLSALEDQSIDIPDAAYAIGRNGMVPDSRRGEESITLPSDSRVKIEQTYEDLTITMPPGAGTGGVGAFSIFWLGFIAFWTMMTIFMRAPFFFPVFSLPFWAIGISMAVFAIKGLASTTILRLSPSGFTETQKIFGTERSKTWPLSDLGRCRVSPSSVRVQGQTRLELRIEAGAGQLKVGTGLSRRELEAIGAAIQNYKKDTRS